MDVFTMKQCMDSENLHKRLNRISGQIAALDRMIDEDIPCEDILIQDNTVYHAHGGFVIGSDVSGGMKNIVVRRCTFSGTDTGLRFKSGIGRGGKTEGIRISDISMTDIKNEAIIFECTYIDKKYNYKEGSEQKNQKVEFAPDFQDIEITRVTSHNSKTAISAHGLEGLKCVTRTTLLT